MHCTDYGGQARVGTFEYKTYSQSVHSIMTLDNQKGTKEIILTFPAAFTLSSFT